MKKIALALIILSCNSKTESHLSSAESREIDRKADSMAKATISEVTRSVYFDTVGVDVGPVRVLSSRVVRKEYSTYKDVALSYKNVSDKKISAIRFRWYGVNAFNEPADMGTSMEPGFGSGFDDTGLRPGKISSGQWNVLSRDAKKVVKAWAYEVAFEDGTSWKSTHK